MIDKNTVSDLLKTVKYPGFSRDIVSFGLIRGIDVKEDGEVHVGISITTGDQRVPAQLKQDIESVLAKAEGVKAVTVDIAVTQPKGATASASPSADGGATGQKVPGVKHIVAVASGKGGVGKSTFTVNFAAALEKILAEKGRPAKVGIMDCDIYGPSVPLMIGITERPDLEDNKIIPVSNFGIKVMSMGLLIDEDTPVVWRGPMVTKTIMQFAQSVNWGELDVLVVDLPPGTGDAQLTLVQTIPLDGAIIVTTPQLAATTVARRGAQMFSKVNVPILGVVENMSYLENKDGSRSNIFGSGGGKQTADALETGLLGQIPLDQEVREGGDNGIPCVIGHVDSTASQEFLKIGNHILNHLGLV